MRRTHCLSLSAVSLFSLFFLNSQKRLAHFHCIDRSNFLCLLPVIALFPNDRPSRRQQHERPYSPSFHCNFSPRPSRVAPGQSLSTLCIIRNLQKVESTLSGQFIPSAVAPTRIFDRDGQIRAAANLWGQHTRKFYKL